jgi:hypothetical protein
MTEYAFDLKLDVAMRVKADTFEQAVAMLKDTLDCAQANFGAWPCGEPVTAEASLNGAVTRDMLYEVDGEPHTEISDALRLYAAARNDGWEPGDEDTPEEYCAAFVPDEEVAAVDASDVESWRDEFIQYVSF